ncbi:MAG: MFS transporter [Lachnospiraceae bacterium]|nr:MFS transporter [Lachnospiraceae bacterium]
MKDHKDKGSWTLRYTLLNMAYFAAFCTIHACAAVYLLSHGFTNTQIGALLAIANITSAICQPYIAGIIDRPGWLTNRRFILISVIVILAGSAVLLAAKDAKTVIFIVYVLIYMIQFAYQPMMTALCFEFQKAGCTIYYGLARGMGSAGFAITSIFVGRAIEAKGTDLLPVISIVLMAVSAILIYTFVKPGGEILKATGAEMDEGRGDGSGDLKAHNNIGDFARTYPAFMVFLVATICFFFAHNMINDFMIQIIRNLGGGETELGYANSLQAILELPVMALIGFALAKISSEKLLVFSGLAFFVKILILIFAKGMTGMYISQSFQLFAYAVFIPAAAYYVSFTMEELDQVKGQAYVTSAITIGGVFSNMLSGVILDHLGVRSMLAVGTAVCAAGVIIAFIAMTRLPHHKKKA